MTAPGTRSADEPPRAGEVAWRRACGSGIVTRPGNLDQVWDQALSLQPIDAEVAHGLEIAWIEPNGAIQTPAAETLAGLCACTAAPADRLPEATTERLTRVPANIGDYLSTGTPAGTLSGMTTQDAKR